jgi:hypothetical protein
MAEEAPQRPVFMVVFEGPQSTEHRITSNLNDEQIILVANLADGLRRMLTDRKLEQLYGKRIVTDFVGPKVTV